MKKLIYIMALGGFGIITTEFGVIGIMPAIASHFNISIDTAGWLVSAFALTIALTGPFSVMLTSKINRKTMMSWALLIFVLSNVLSAMAPNFTVLLIARILPAFMHPIFWSVAIVAASKQVAPKDAPKAVSVIMGSLSVATVLGVPLLTYIADLLNWKAAFIAAGIINLIAFVALTAFVPSMPVTEKRTQQSQIKALGNRRLWINLGGTLLMIAGMFSTYGYLAEYLSKVADMSGKQISLMLMLFGGAGIIGNWVASIALSKNVVLTTRLFLLALIGAHILVYVFGGLFALVAATVAVWGLIHTAGFMIMQIRTSSEAPEAPELATSLMVSFGNAGATLGTFLGGIAITHYGIHNLIWMSVLLLVVVLVLSFVFDRKRTARNEPVQVKEVEMGEEVRLSA
jgi:DHA1 family inner membrane transport protein